MLRKFFFDDVRDAPDSTWVVARDVPEAMRILSEQRFDVWSLDHDIGMQMACDECYKEVRRANPGIASRAEMEDALIRGCNHSEHGTHLVKWALETLTEWPQLCIIHSANRYGSERMRSLLEDKVNRVLVSFYNKEFLRSIE